MSRERIKKPVTPAKLEPEKLKSQGSTQTTKTPAKPMTPEQLQRAKARFDRDTVVLQRKLTQVRPILTLNKPSKSVVVDPVIEARVQREAMLARQEVIRSSFVKSPTQRSALQSMKNSSIEVSDARDSYQAVLVPEILQRLVDSEMTVQAQQARANQQPNDLNTRADWFNTELPCPS